MEMENVIIESQDSYQLWDKVMIITKDELASNLTRREFIMMYELFHTSKESDVTIREYI